jgi:hypothetical protein
MDYLYSAKHNQQDKHIDIDKRTAYHQAGHAAAIYLGNKQKQLPAVHFQISVKQQDSGSRSDQFARPMQRYTVKVEGGRLIQTLPLSFADATQTLTLSQQIEFRCAFEADVINLLVGYLAEAKYVALRDEGIFSTQSVNIAALHSYGSNLDIGIITEYMECLIPDSTEREQKLEELFLAAYNFVNHRTDWRAISALAEYIHNEPKSIIGCEEVISLLESRLAA